MSCGFSKKLISDLVCQKDGAILSIDKITRENEQSVFDGQLVCATCQSHYEIKDGIVNLLIDKHDLEQLMQDEISARDKEAGQYDKRLSVRYYKELPSTFKKIGDCHNKKVIEYGCGTGRLTQELVTRCDQILAVDFSVKSLKLLADKFDNKDNIGLVLADATKFKSVNNSFDIALSFQFLEHVPTLEQRKTWLNSVHQTLIDGGLFISTVYHQSLRRRIKKQPQEGSHPFGIFFHYFFDKEIKDELKTYFNIVNLHPIDITLPLEARLNIPMKLAGLLSRLSEHIPIVNQLGHLLIVKAKNKS
ncbi:methyltransferase domain-containing protein [bacterium]|jgi:ubiquinone/menaquinone biosynthesis C-methylase UbiE|nr:methyltransferase domain-containing protein [bacterium]MBT4649410.1 methyltransferase domain-containing protein [bacterium]